MRIAVVLFAFPEPSETFVLDQLAGLRAAGHDITIIARRRSATPAVHPVLEDGTLEAGLRTGDDAGSALGGVARHLTQHPVTTVQAVTGALQTGTTDHLRLANVTSDLPPFDVIHAHFGPNGLLAVRLRQLGAIDGPIVTSFHGIDLTRTVRERGETFYQPLFAAGDLHLPVSERFHQRLIELGADPLRCIVHHMGVDTERLSFRARPPSTAGLRLLSVARLVKKKGLATAVRAFAAHHRSEPTSTYTIVGDGPERSALEGLARELGVGEAVTITGWRTVSEVATAMGDADLLLAPSLTADDGDAEGIPVTIMEAMACGLPVVATRHSGIPELVTDGVTGRLVAESDHAALAEAISDLARTRESWPAITRAAREIVERDYSMREQNRRLLRHFEVMTTSV